MCSFLPEPATQLSGVVKAGGGGACLKLGEDWTILGVALRLRRSD